MTTKRVFHSHPLSEVVCGVTFKNLVFNQNNIFQIQSELLKTTYPLCEILPPLGDELLLREENRLQVEVEPQKTGAVLYRFRTEDQRGLIQIQGNKFYYNWIRQNAEQEFYPGFAEIFKTFHSLLTDIQTILSRTIVNSVKSCELGYHDRIDWKKYADTESIHGISQIVNFSLPTLLTTNDNTAEVSNFSSRYVSSLPHLYGYCTTVIGTDNMPSGRLGLRVENSVRGNQQNSVDMQSIKEWFDKANELQNSLFYNIFTERVREQWKQQ
ncbi:MAG: TIGR04255 family protein [Candidatus Kapabacteria bacterium]|jgi:uncharacterized protein (TIGR04255 family)|nr:TIGR04255 family protein [Candidatus Kapabacteria bacterium]